MTRKVDAHMTSCATSWLPERHKTAPRTCAVRPRPSVCVAIPSLATCNADPGSHMRSGATWLTRARLKGSLGRAGRPGKVFEENLDGPDLAHHMARHRRGSWLVQRSPAEGLKKFSKIAVDGAITGSYMAVHRRGWAIWLWSRSRLIDRYFRCPRIKTGRVKRRLFDIVGLDEGTCGRRLRSPRSLRPRRIG